MTVDINNFDPDAVPPKADKPATQKSAPLKTVAKPVDINNFDPDAVEGAPTQPNPTPPQAPTTPDTPRKPSISETMWQAVDRVVPGVRPLADWLHHAKPAQLAIPIQSAGSSIASGFGNIVGGTAQVIGKTLAQDNFMGAPEDDLGAAGRSFFQKVSDAGKHVKDIEDEGNRITKGMLEKHGANYESTSGQVLSTAGGIGGMAVKYGNPFGFGLMLLESGMGKAANTLNDEQPLGKALTAGVLDAATIAAISKIPGGEKAYKSVVKLVASRAFGTGVEGVAFGTMDALIDKIVLSKHVGWAEWKHDVAEATKMMAAIKLAHGVGEVNSVNKAKEIANQYTSPQQAENAILGKAQEAHARMTAESSTPQEAKKAEEEVKGHLKDLKALDHAKKSGMKFKGADKSDVDVQKEIKEALGEMPRTGTIKRPTKDAAKAGLEQHEDVSPGDLDPNASPAPFIGPLEGVKPGAPTRRTTRSELEEAMNAPDSSEINQIQSLPAHEVRALLTPEQQAKMDEAMAPHNKKMDEANAENDRVQEAFSKILAKAKNRAYAKFGKKVTDADVQRILRTDIKTVAELKALHEEAKRNQADHDVAAQGRETAAAPFRAMVRLPKNGGPNAGQEQSPTALVEQPSGAQGTGGEGRPGVEPVQQGQTPTAPEAPKEEVAPKPALTEEEMGPIVPPKSEESEAPKEPTKPKLTTPMKSKLAKRKAAFEALRDQEEDANLPPVLVGKKKVGGTYMLDPKSMVVDPKKYQFREFLYDPLAGAKVYNADMAGTYWGWVDEDGKVALLDGHHRIKLALATGQEEIPVKIIHAKDASEARVAGAMKNISEGNANPVDAARLFREAKITPADLEARGIPMKRGVVEDASALADLTDDWFTNVVRDENWEKAGIVVGKNIKDADQQTALLNILGKAKKADLSPEYIKNLCDEIKAAKINKGEGSGLFGEEDLQDNVKERAQIAAEVEKDIQQDQQAANAGAKKRIARKLEAWKVAEGGVDTELAGEIGEENKRLLEAFRAEKNHTGGISDAIDEYANQLLASKDGKQAKRIKSEAVEAVRAALQAHVAGSKGQDSGASEETPGRGEEGKPEEGEGLGLGEEAKPEPEPEKPKPVRKTKDIKKPKAKVEEAPSTEKTIEVPPVKTKTKSIKKDKPNTLQESGFKKVNGNTYAKSYQTEDGKRLVNIKEGADGKFHVTESHSFTGGITGPPSKPLGTFDTMAEAVSAVEPTKAEVKEANRDQARELAPGDENKDIRAEIHRELPPGTNPTPEEVAVAAIKAKAKRGKLPKDKGQAGFLNLEGVQNVGEVMHNVGQAFKAVGIEGTEGFKNMRRRAVLELAKSLDKMGVIQHGFDKTTGAMPKIAESMISGVVPRPLKDKTGKNMDIENLDPKSSSRLAKFRSPQKLIAKMFKPGQGPNVDQELMSNRYLVTSKALSDYVADVHKRNGIEDHSVRVGKAMDPIREKIMEISPWLGPLAKQSRDLRANYLRLRKQAIREATEDMEAKVLRDALGKSKKAQKNREGLGDGQSLKEMAKLTEDQLLEAMDKGDNAKHVLKAKQAVIDFHEDHGERLEQGQKDLKELYEQANEKVRELAQTTPEVRVALAMEPKEKRPDWLHAIIKPNEVKAARELLEFTRKAGESAKDLGIKVRNEDYITHLLTTKDALQHSRDRAGNDASVGRDILNFHQRQANSVNLMPSTHAAMAYYVPTISRKIATQPFLNKWFAGGRNVYLDKQSPYFAEHFGRHLQKQIDEIEHPPVDNIWDRGLQHIKDAEITKDMAFNQRVTIKHIVGKMTGLVALHHSYLAPASREYMSNMAHRAENLPFVSRAYEAVTGKPMTHDADKDLVQTLMANLVSSRQIRNALLEDPLVAEYNLPITNALVRKGASLWNKTKNLMAQPLTAAEAMENELNFLASAHHGVTAGLSPEENVKGIVTNLLNYSFRGGHDSSTFLKSTVGRMTAFSQTPTKMLENYADIIKKGLGNEKDIYGDSGSATLVRALVAAGAVSYLGEKYGKKGGLHLYNMLLHVPFVNEGFASDIFGYAAHTVASAATTGDKSKHHHHEATKSLRRFVGGQTNSINVSPAWDIAKDVTQAVTSPKGFVKSIPAVQQLRSELPAKMGGAKNKNYEDTAHYLASAPKPSAERHWDKEKENQGKATIHKILKNARK